MDKGLESFTFCPTMPSTHAEVLHFHVVDLQHKILDTPTLFTYIRVRYCPNIQVVIIIGLLKVHNKMESFSQRTRLRLNFANLTQIPQRGNYPSSSLTTDGVLPKIKP